MVSSTPTASRPSKGTVTQELPVAWRSGAVFVAVGSGLIIAGGLVAAVTRPTGFEEGAWVAAFLVLVGGVAQILVGGGQAALVADAPPRTTLAVELVTWNLACAATVIGTLIASPPLTTVGGLALIASLVVFLVAVLKPGTRHGWARTAYVSVIGFVIISTPVGLVLAWVRHG